MKVTKRIPPPVPRNKYPLKTMKVGESFYMEGYTYDRQRMMANLAKKAGIRVTSRKEGTGLRVWRIEEKK